MTSIRQLITDGFREAGIIETGGEPEAAEFEEGFRHIQRLFSSLFGNELGEQLSTINYGTNGLSNPYAIGLDVSPDILSTYIPNNYRLIFNNNSTITLPLSPDPMDGARLGIIDNSGTFATHPVTLSGNGRAIEGAASVTLNTNNLNREWFYRGDLGSWQRVSDLDENGVSPLPVEFDDLLTSLLAFRLNPRYGAATEDNMVEVLKRMRSQFRSRYRQTMEKSSEDGLVRLPSNPFSRVAPSNFTAFKQGR